MMMMDTFLLCGYTKYKDEPDDIEMGMDDEDYEDYTLCKNKNICINCAVLLIKIVYFNIIFIPLVILVYVCFFNI
jgi:hypothetical protein